MKKAMKKAEVFGQIKTLLGLDECTSIKTITVHTIREEDINVDPVDVCPAKRAAGADTGTGISAGAGKKSGKASASQDAVRLKALRKWKKEGKLSKEQLAGLGAIGYGALSKAKKAWIEETYTQINIG